MSRKTTPNYRDYLHLKVHPLSDRDPVPLAIHHHPVCSTFAFFNTPKPSTGQAETDKAIGSSESAVRTVCMDPTWQEEQVMDGKLVVGVNPYKEICTLHLAGNMLINKVKRIQNSWKIYLDF